MVLLGQLIGRLLPVFLLPLWVHSQHFPSFKFYPIHTNSPWPSFSINNHVIDKSGIIWFTSETAGLLRYDGRTIRQSIRGDKILSSLYKLSIDKDNLFYISSADGLIKFDPLTEKLVTYNNNKADPGSLADDDKPTPFVDSRNRVWVSSAKGLQQLDRQHERFIRYEIPPPPPGLPVDEYSHLGSITEDKQGNIWIASAYGLYRVDTAAKKLEAYYTGKYCWLTGIAAFDKDELWITTWGAGIIKFNLLTRTFSQFPLTGMNDDVTEDICEYRDIDNKRWIGFTDTRSFILADPQTGQYKKYLNDPSGELALPGETINTVFNDDDLRLWIITEKGAYVVDNMQQQLITYPLHLQQKKQKSEYGTPRFWFDNGNEIWLSLWYGAGVAKYSSQLSFKSQQFLFPPQSASHYSRSVNCIVKDPSGCYWFSTDSGLVKQCGTSYKVYLPAKNQLSEKGTSFRNILQLPDGRWWIRSLYSGMFLFDPKTTTFTTRLFPPGIQEVSAVCLDKKNRLWMGTDKGIFLLDSATQQLVHYPLSDPRNSRHKLLNYILDMMTDQEGNIWMSTYAGLAVLEPQSRTISYPLWNEKTSFSPCYRMVQDNNGIIWIVSTEKLFAYNMAAKKLTSFSKEIGLPPGFSLLGVFKKTSDGNLWLSYLGGLCSFNPSSLLKYRNKNTGKVVVTDFYCDSTRTVVNDHMLTVSKGTTGIRINFAFTNYSITQQNILYYRLYKNGGNMNWQQTNGDLNFINLQPGDYTLELKGENDALNTPPVIETYSLSVLPQWYQTRIFIAGMVLLVGSALFYITRWRIREIKSKAAIRQKIAETEIAALKAQMNPHFIFNCINSIDAFIHSNDKYNATLYLNKFARLLRNVLDSSKATTVNLADDVKTLKLYIELEELRHDHKFNTSFSIDEYLLQGDFNVPPLIVQPFVENAILHGLGHRQGQNGHLQISIRKVADNIEYTITDNGIGRDAAAKINKKEAYSYGIQMSFDRIKLFNRESEPAVVITDLYENGAAAGTAVKVTLKMI